MTFGERIVALRQEHAMTRSELAQKLNMPYTTLRNYETDSREAGHSLLLQLADLFDVSVDYLLGVNNTKAPAALPGGLDREETTIITIYRSLPQEGKSVLYQVADYIYRATSPQHDRSEIERAVDVSLAIERQAAKDTAHSQAKSQEAVGR